MPASPLDLDLSAQSLALGRGHVSALALTEAALSRIGQWNPTLNAFLHVDEVGARRAAAASDARHAQGRSCGPLDGVAVAIKDNIDVAGMPTTAGMATRRGRMATGDAFVVKRLRAAGAVILGKLNMHEAALGSSNDNPYYGRCHNPLRIGHSPGGSSGGSAAAVAAGLCALALGTDTMGSVRLPAAYCGVVGFKPSRGLVSTAGSVVCSRLLDHVGPLVRSASDLRLVMPVLAAFDAANPDARPLAPRAPQERVRLVAALDVRTLGASDEVAQAYEHALQQLRDQGHAVNPIDLSRYDFGAARRAGLLAVEAELLLAHADDWREQPHNFSAELTRFLRFGERQSATALAAAWHTMAAAHAEAARWFQQGDVMVLPTTPQTAFAFGTPTPANAADFTALANMTGMPALQVPLPCAPGDLPAGLQFIAPLGHDATLLALDLSGVAALPMGALAGRAPPRADGSGNGNGNGDGSGDGSAGLKGAGA